MSSLEVHGMNILRKRLINVKDVIGIAEKYITDSERIVMNKLRN